MILRMLPGPFVAWLAVLLFLLVMQFLIKYLPQLVGKGLPFLAIVELITYNLAYMMVLAVPMAALITTLMAFGKLAETNAYAVIKGSGVSFPQLVWPIYVVGILLTAGMWYFNTEFHPEANFRARNLWQDIKVSKPGFDLQAGVFYDGIDQYKILVGDIPIDNPNELHDVTIFDYSDGSRFRTDISASRGLLEPITVGNTLNLVLFDGEVHRKRPPGSGNTDRYERLSFDRHLIRISLEDLNFNRSDPREGTRTQRTMKSREMIVLVNSLDSTILQNQQQLRVMMAELGTGSISRTETGSLIRDQTRVAVFNSEEDSFSRQVRDTSIKSRRSLRMKIDRVRRDLSWLQDESDEYKVEIHKKYSIAIACLIFMMIGAPLGLFIRKGGLGTAAALAVGIFLFHWVSLANGEKLADRGFIEPWLGMWLADIVTGIIAIWLTFFVWRDLKSIPLFSFRQDRSETKSTELSPDNPSV